MSEQVVSSRTPRIILSVVSIFPLLSHDCRKYEGEVSAQIRRKLVFGWLGYDTAFATL